MTTLLPAEVERAAAQAWRLTARAVMIEDANERGQRLLRIGSLLRRMLHSTADPAAWPHLTSLAHGALAQAVIELDRDRFQWAEAADALAGLRIEIARWARSPDMAAGAAVLAWSAAAHPAAALLIERDLVGFAATAAQAEAVVGELRAVSEEQGARTNTRLLRDVTPPALVTSALFTWLAQAYEVTGPVPLWQHGWRWVPAVRRRVPGDTSLVYGPRDVRWPDLELTLHEDGGGDTRLRLRSLGPTSRPTDVAGWRVAVVVNRHPEPIVATTQANGKAIMGEVTLGDLADVQMMLLPPSLEAPERWHEAAASLVSLAADGAGVPETRSDWLYQRLEAPLPDTKVEVNEGQIRFDEAARTLSIPLALKTTQGQPDARYVGQTLLMISNVGKGRGTTLASVKLTAASGTLLVDVDDDTLLPLLRSGGLAGVRNLTSWVRFVLGAEDQPAALGHDG